MMWSTVDHEPPPVRGAKVSGIALLFPQPQVLVSHALSKKYSCYLLKWILSLPHLIIQWWTLDLSTGWKITCFSKYKISISAAFASPSSHPWPWQPAAIQTLTVIMWWSERERWMGQGGGGVCVCVKFISSLWDVYCFFLLSAVQSLCHFMWCFIMGAILVGTNEFICRDAWSLEIQIYTSLTPL